MVFEGFMCKTRLLARWSKRALMGDHAARPLGAPRLARHPLPL